MDHVTSLTAQTLNDHNHSMKKSDIENNPPRHSSHLEIQEPTLLTSSNSAKSLTKPPRHAPYKTLKSKSYPLQAQQGIQSSSSFLSSQCHSVPRYRKSQLQKSQYQNSPNSPNSQTQKSQHRDTSHNKSNHKKIGLAFGSELRVTLNNLLNTSSSTTQSFIIPETPESEITQLWNRVRDTVAQTPQEFTSTMLSSKHSQFHHGLPNIYPAEIGLPAGSTVIKDKCTKLQLNDDFEGETMFSLDFSREDAKQFADEMLEYKNEDSSAKLLWRIQSFFFTPII